jgi:hypothetical protein
MVIRTEEGYLELDVLQDAALTVVNMMSPMGANFKESLHALPMQVAVVVTHGIHQGATMALAAT